MTPIDRRDTEFMRGLFKLLRLWLCSLSGPHDMKFSRKEYLGGKATRTDYEYVYIHSKCCRCGYRNYEAK